MGRGRFIVLEGGDGVGKSTQSRFLVDWLTGQGVPHLVTRQPGGTPLGLRLRELVLDPAMGEVSPRCEALLYAADKAQHVAEVIEPALAEGRVVVSDRYVDSMIAYQGAGRDLDLGEIEALARWATGGLRPDLTILLDAHPDEAVSNIEVKDRLEGAGADFHSRVREHFLHLASRDEGRYVVVDARRPREVVAAEIAVLVSRLLAGSVRG